MQVSQNTIKSINFPVSGEVPQIPVVSVKSGHLFEKSLIEKYIEEHHKCPVTGADLESEDLVEVKGFYSILK